MPIGGAIAYPDHISPSGVGYDIGCGNKAVATSLLYSDISRDMPRIMDEVVRRISFGIGRPNNEPVDHPRLDIIDKIARDAPITAIRQLQPLAAAQLGTVGSGNHYVDILREAWTDRVWIGVHFGSRGFGHKIASGFLAMAQGMAFSDRAPEGGMFAPPTLLDTRTSLGQAYVGAMELAGEYAYAGRDVVVDKVLDILGNPSVLHEVHNHHNYAWREWVDGRWCWVVRKGCTPLYPGQQGFVGGSMGEDAVIIEGDLQHALDARDALFSAPHGAGRQMSRTEAKGKQRKRWHDPATGWTQQPGEAAPQDTTGLTKIWVTERAGRVDWAAVQERLRQQGIHLRGGDADEAPEAYKRLPDVIAAHAPHVKIKHTLTPVGVAMAGRGVNDPYKD